MEKAADAKDKEAAEKKAKEVEITLIVMMIEMIITEGITTHKWTRNHRKSH